MVTYFSLKLFTRTQDSSKQICGSSLLHIYNIISAGILNQGQNKNDLDPCQWYFATFMFDIILITFLSWLILQLLQCVLRRNCPRFAFKSGDYYGNEKEEHQGRSDQYHRTSSPPARQILQESINKGGEEELPHQEVADPYPFTRGRRQVAVEIQDITVPVLQDNKQKKRKVPWKQWLYQLSVWLLILTFAKCLLVLLLWAIHTQIGWLIGKILNPLVDYPNYELITVMIIVPVIFNALQYWIIDSFIKKKEKKEKKNSNGEISQEQAEEAQYKQQQITYIQGKLYLILRQMDSAGSPEGTLSFPDSSSTQSKKKDKTIHPISMEDSVDDVDDDDGWYNNNNNEQNSIKKIQKLSLLENEN